MIVLMLTVKASLACTSDMAICCQTIDVTSTHNAEPDMLDMQQ